MRRDERGAALAELAIFAPLLVLVAVLATGVTSAVVSYSRLNDLSVATARYATRAAPDPEAAGYRLRPSAADVEAYARRVATVDVVSVTVVPDPSAALPGEPVRIVIRARVPLPLLSQTYEIESSTVMREE